MGDHTVPSGVDVGQPGAHLLVDDHRPSHAGFCAGSNQKLGVGPDPDRYEDDISQAAETAARLVRSLDHQPASAPRRGAGHAPDRCRGRDIYAMGGQLSPDERSQLGVDGGEDLRQRLDLSHPQPSEDQAFGHLQADVTGPDDQRDSRPLLVQRALQ